MNPPSVSVITPAWIAAKHKDDSSPYSPILPPITDAVNDTLPLPAFDAQVVGHFRKNVVP
jgi:hypothetical protein